MLKNFSFWTSVSWSVKWGCDFCSGFLGPWLTVLASWGFHTKLPLTWWLNFTAEIYSPHSCRGQKSEIKVYAELVPSGGSEGEYITYLSLSFCWLSVTAGIAWLVDTSLQSLCLHITFFPVSQISLSLPLIRTLVFGFRVFPKSRKISSQDL